MIYRFVVYRNRIGVIQFADEYINAEKGETERGFLGSRSRGPNSEDGVGAGAREKRDAVRNMSMKRKRD